MKLIGGYNREYTNSQNSVLMKNKLRKHCPKQIYQLYGNTKYWLRFKFHPQGLASELFKGILGYEMNWNNPQDLNEKINWMKFNYDTTEWTRLADKYLVRDYVKERIGEDVLVKLFGVWEKAEEIDFDKLPNKFVLKTNHGAGTVLPVLDKSQLDIDKTRKQLNDWLKIKYGYLTVELHYLGIRPLVIAEELLINDSNFSSSLVDYKVYCFDGKPFCILVCSDRTIGKQAHFTYYDLNWNRMPDVLIDKLKSFQTNVPKPKHLDQLLDCAEKLAKGHPQVRVDFYILKDKIYFGEMTFTSEGGYDGDVTREFCTEMGSHITL